MQATFQKRIFILFAFIFIVVTSVGVYTISITNSLISSFDWVEHTREVIQKVNDITLLQREMEADVKDYVISGDRTEIKRLINYSHEAMGRLAELEFLVSDYPAQKSNLSELQRLVDQNTGLAADILVIRDRLGYQYAKKIIASRVDDRLIDQFNHVIFKIRDLEIKLLADRQQVVINRSERFVFSLFLLKAILLLMLIVVLISVRYNVMQRNRTEEKLKKSLEKLANFRVLFEKAPGLYLILNPDLIIEAVSDEYLKATLTQRHLILGRHLFDVFPDNPDDANADGTSNLAKSLDTVLRTKEEQRMARQKYDVRDAHGVFVEKYWDPSNRPVLDEQGNVTMIIHSAVDVTKKVIQERELKQATEEIRDLYDNAPNGYLSVDSNRMVTNINHTLLNWLGYSLEDVKDVLRFDQLLSPTQREAFKGDQSERFAEFRKTGILNDLEIEFQRKDGTILPVVLNSLAVFDESGNFIRSRTTVFDNTERLLNQQRLNQTLLELKHYQYAVDASAIVNMTDEKGIVKYVNENFLKITKYNPEEVIGHPISILYTEYHTEEFTKAMWNTIESGKVWQGEMRQKDKYGSIFWTESSIIPFIDETGKPFQYIAIRFDITKQIVQQELLMEQSEELKSRQQELQDANAELEAQSENLQASEVELKAQRAQLLRTNQELEFRSIELEELNTAFHEKNTKLELVYDELNRKAQELEQSSNYKSEFLANMSHELRTPLNSILLLSKLLADNGDGNLTPEQSEFAIVIYNSGMGLLELINDILDLSKIEAGKMEVEYDAVELAHISKNVHSLFDQLALGKGVDFVLKVEEDLPVFIKTDRLRLEQVLKNFLSNAFKFTEKGMVKLHIRHPEPSELSNIHGEPEGFVAFEVQDSGIGIAKEKQELVFEAFRQSDGSTKRKYGGTGLGLSISKKIAELLNGTIVLNSEMGKGSSFVFIIPVDASSQNDSMQYGIIPDQIGDQENGQSNGNSSEYVLENTPKEISDDRYHILPQSKVILIVEDDTVMANLLMKYIHDRGYQVVVAVSGANAVRYALQYKPVGILLDIQLPKKNGWKILQELKQNSNTRSIPVYTMSSHSFHPKESIDQGAVDFLVKPVSADAVSEMLDKMEEVLGNAPKTILLVDHNEIHTTAISRFINDASKRCLSAPSVEVAAAILQKEKIDCLILDMGLPDETGYQMLEWIKHQPGLEKLPVIIYTGQSISIQEERKLKAFADAIVLKTVDSFRRLSDEISLFLHTVEKQQEQVNSAAPYLRDQVLAGKRILLVDDDVRNIFSLTKLLESQHAIVNAASDGQEALDLLNEDEHYDLVLMDMMMPGKDGYETTAEIRKDPRFMNIPIIAVTAKAMLGDRQKCMDAGASDYLTKPVDADQLLSLIRVWLYSLKS